MSIATNRDEKEETPDCSSKDVVYCMTVHKAKGLEFNTVIVPFNREINKYPHSDIQLSKDGKKVGWRYYRRYGMDAEESIDVRNENYLPLYKNNLHLTEKEETRLLYVAMTRVIDNLILYVYPYKAGEYSWSELIEEGTS